MQPELIGGRYRVQRAIGQGGMGTVWLCRDETLRRDVAVKQIGSLPGESAADTARAMREARSAAALNHRNAVSVYNVVDHDGGPWLVMEYVPSKDLSQIIRDDGPLPAHRVAFIGAQIADALVAAHALGIVHRDVKPGNILISEGDLAKIGDFGIARADSDTQLTLTGMTTGTPAYMAPEVARGADPSGASDVWALGAALFAAVEGNPPFGTDGNPLAVLSRITNEPVPRPENAGPLLPVLETMLSKDPDARVPMTEVARLLHELPRSSPPTRVIDDAYSWRTPAEEATPAATPIPPVPPPTSDPEPVPDDDGERRSRGWLVPLVIGLLLILALSAGAYLLARDPGSDTATDPIDTQTSAPRRDSPSTTKTPKTTGPPTTPAPTTEPTTTPPTTPPPTTEAASGQELVDVVEGYYALLPDDTDSAFQLLGGSLKAQGRDSYQNFWDTVDSVEVSNAAAESDDTVTYDITFNLDNGDTSDERHRLYLKPRGDSYVITDEDIF